MKEVGIVGVPYSGKTTLFTALTNSGSAGGRSNQAVVDVPDPRLGVLADITSELIIADLASVEGGLEKARKKARGSAEGKAEVAALEAAHALLDEERPLSEGTFEESALKVLRGFGPLSMKPWIVVLNVEEGGDAGSFDGDAVVVSAALEAEVGGMEPADAAELLAGF